MKVTAAIAIGLTCRIAPTVVGGVIIPGRVATTGVLATVLDNWILALTSVTAVFVHHKAIHAIEWAEDGFAFFRTLADRINTGARLSSEAAIAVGLAITSADWIKLFGTEIGFFCALADSIREIAVASLVFTELTIAARVTKGATTGCHFRPVTYLGFVTTAVTIRFA